MGRVSLHVIWIAVVVASVGRTSWADKPTAAQQAPAEKPRVEPILPRGLLTVRVNPGWPAGNGLARAGISLRPFAFLSVPLRGAFVGGNLFVGPNEERVGVNVGYVYTFNKPELYIEPVYTLAAAVHRNRWQPNSELDKGGVAYGASLRPAVHVGPLEISLKLEAGRIAGELYGNYSIDLGLSIL